MTTWLLMAAGDDREHGGNAGYLDDPSRKYLWDSTVYHCNDVTVGDVVALWDKKSLIGMSVVDDVARGQYDKVLKKCPECGKAAIKARATVTPLYKCYKCGALFDEAAEVVERVTTFCSVHERAWVDLGGAVDGDTLRRLCVQPRSQHSIREIRHAPLLERIEEVVGAAPVRLLERAAEPTGVHGHRSALVRTRLGQGAFRRKLVDRFGLTCAITGDAPAQALEAAHLYSYADVGRHRSGGGLLLRRDVHRLFDLGLLAFHPDRGCVSVHEDLRRFPLYSALEGQALHVKLSDTESAWLRQHWSQWREST